MTLDLKEKCDVNYKIIQPQTHRGITHQNRELQTHRGIPLQNQIPITQVMEFRTQLLKFWNLEVLFKGNLSYGIYKCSF